MQDDSPSDVDQLEDDVDLPETIDLPIFFLNDWEPEPNPPDISKPRVLTCWSGESARDGGSIAWESNSGRGLYRPPPLGSCLYDGCLGSAHVRKDPMRADGVEKVVTAASRAGNPWPLTHVCTFRNNLNKILATRLSPKAEWAVEACVVGSTMFLDIVKSPERDYANMDRLQYAGYKFEALCTGSEVVDETSEYVEVVQYCLGSINVLMAAEIDCFYEEPDGALPPGNAELKVFQLPGSGAEERRSVAQRFPRFWIQSFLAGVPYLVAGLRSKTGVLQAVECYEVSRLPSLAAAAGAGFDPGDLLDFGYGVLSWMLDCCHQQPEKHVRFHYDPAEAAIVCGAVEHDTLPGRVAAALSV